MKNLREVSEDACRRVMRRQARPEYRQVGAELKRLISSDGHPARLQTTLARAGFVTATPVAWRRSNTSRTAIEPSPMAVATRLTDRLRTSPTQKIPGRLVSEHEWCVLDTLEAS